jgi:hypothetical protein
MHFPMTVSSKAWTTAENTGLMHFPMTVSSQV